MTKQSFTDYLETIRLWLKEGGELPAMDDSRVLGERRQTARNR